MSPEPPEVRPFRWIGAIAFFGVVSAALAVLAVEAIDDSFTWIGDGRSQSDAVILATEPPPEGTGSDAAADGSAEEQQADDESSDEGQADDSSADEGQDEAAADGGNGEDQPPATYTVQPGDTGSSIAGDLLGDQQAWSRIAELNDIPPGAILSVGDVLRIPES